MDREWMRLIGTRPVLFDGGMGTLLQSAGLPMGMAPDVWNMERPDIVKQMHARYLEAGADIIKTNTFGANAYKLKNTPYTVEQVVRRAVETARAAADGYVKRHVALDIGPTGKLLQPLGDLAFEDAYALFAEIVIAGRDAGADCILIETQNDAYELKAAVLAARENAELPVFATVTADAKGKLLTGADMDTVAALLEGLGVDALGLNCGLGPQQMLPFLKRLREVSSLPLIMNPNAGLPHSENGRTAFDVGPEAFAESMAEAVAAGAWLIGGCCGTTPAHIAAMAERVQGMQPVPIVKRARTVVSSHARTVVIGEKPVLIGERLNPTGKKRMKEALLSNEMDYLLREGIRQQECGAEILDVNVGLPNIDEKTMLPQLVTALQSVTDLPLQIDTSDPAALERALRRYNGKPLINSVNGKQSSMETVLPLAKKYGGVVVALTLDESGIPDTAEGRVRIAEKIIRRAADYGIDRQDIVVDPLALAVSAAPNAATVALQTIQRVKRELGVHTVLGVSNISFGLPDRELINATFFTLALGAGLDMAIMNPYAARMTEAYATYCMLSGQDKQCAKYIADRAAAQGTGDKAPAAKAAEETLTLSAAIQKGLSGSAAQAAGQLLTTDAPMSIIEREMIPALNLVGEAFEAGRVFLPQLLMSAEAAKAAFEVLRGALSAKERGGRGRIVLATVHGDIHDIGKNIVRSLLENFRFDVVDLGRDVKPEAVAEAVLREQAGLVGLSALMTTTLTSMEETIRLVRRSSPDCKVMVGGAVLTESYARAIGADWYASDAMGAVRFAEQLFG